VSFLLETSRAISAMVRLIAFDTSRDASVA
jgi:hypothetical protein